MNSGGTYFTGGGGVEIAFRACGIEGYFGVEYDDAIAQVARDNGFSVTTSDVREINPATLPRVDWFHASPVCKNASNIKSDGEESLGDMETAQAVERYIDCHKPRIFSLENVWGYRKFKAFQDILKCLARNGYQTAYWHLNSADYGVPQTRKRLILVARNDGKNINRPTPTHAKKPAPMFDDRKKWIGWEKSAGDLLNNLTEWKFTERVTRHYNNNMPRIALVQTKETSFSGRSLTIRCVDSPCFTLQAAHDATSVAIYMDGKHYRTNKEIIKRFASFPDTYKLPNQERLAYHIIGNAVPPLLMQRVIEANL